MATRTLYPSIAPSLDLNFAGSKTLDPRISFSRASAATYYDGKTVVKAEENLWFPSAPIPGGGTEIINTANAGTAPDGTQTAGLSVPNAVSANHLSGYKNVTVTNAEQVFSFYAKAAGYNRVRAGDPSSGRMAATFDLAANTVSNTGGVSYLDSGITDIGSGWKRCWLKFNNNGASGSALGVTPFPEGGTVNNYGQFTGIGDGASGVYLWGFQLEQRSQVTAYTPTTTQPITNYIPVLQTAPAGVPRFDHNPVTGESLGLLVEEQRTNLLTRSQEFDILWGKIGSAVLTNILVSPDGTLSADKIIADTTSSSHRVDSGVVLAQNSSYTFSCFAKVGEYGGIAFNVAGGSASATYNLIAGTVTGAGGTVDAGSVSAAIQPVGNGWYRCIFSFTWLNAAITNTSIRVCLANSATNTAGQPSFTGDGYSGVYIWGAQIEVGTFPTSYIKTEASQVTRAADLASMTGTNFSSWYRQDEGSIFAEFDYFGMDIAGQVARPISITDGLGSGSNSVAPTAQSSNFSAGIYHNGSATLSCTIPDNPLANKAYKMAFGYKTNSAMLAASGKVNAEDTSGTLPYLTTLLLGQSRFGSGNMLSGHLRKVSHYPKRLTDAQLQALTL